MTDCLFPVLRFPLPVVVVWRTLVATVAALFILEEFLGVVDGSLSVRSFSHLAHPREPLLRTTGCKAAAAVSMRHGVTCHTIAEDGSLLLTVLNNH